MLLPARHCSFNPRLTSAARRTTPLIRFGLTIAVSIRASLQQRGELKEQEPIELLKWRFNPRLTSAARRTRARAGFVAVL